MNQPGDRYEQEADQVAEQIMRTPETSTPEKMSIPVHHRDTRLQRLCSTCDGELRRRPVEEKEESQRNHEVPSQLAEVTPDVEAQIEALRGTGHPLPESVRAFFEPRLGHDFGQVRVHTDTRAAATARALSAQAYTIERDIVFGAGQYAPETTAGRQLLAHELTHVVQQGAASRVQRPAHRGSARDHSVQPDGAPRPLDPGASSIRLIVPDGPEIFIRPPAIDTTGAPSEGPSATNAQAAEQTPPEPEPIATQEEEIGARIQRMPRYASRPGLIQRTAAFTNPTFQAQDPLTRLAAGQTPGLTTPTINGNVIASHQDILSEVSPTQVSQTGSAAGNVTCRFARNFTIDTSADVIVASNAGARGWVGSFPVAALGNPPVCAGQARIPATMTALPSNADFVARVRTSEQEHVDDIRALHDRHFVPYDRFLMGLSGKGADLNACGQDLVNQLGNRHTQAAIAFTFGYQAATERLDGPGGTHLDTAVPTFAANCASVSLVLSQAAPPIRGSAPGNVVAVAPTATTFNPAKLKAVGAEIRDGKTVIKSFSTPANAQRALKVIQHYGMTSRNVIGPMEYFLVGKNAPSGALAGANERPIDPAMYQVTFNVPSAGDWAITEVVGNNINVLVNFGARRNEAYSAWAVMRGLAFTRLCWIGGSRHSPEMLYFRT